MVFSYEDMLVLHVMSQHKQMVACKPPLDLSTKPLVVRKRKHDDINLDQTDVDQKFGEKPKNEDMVAEANAHKRLQIPIASQLLAAITGATTQINALYARSVSPDKQKPADDVTCKREPMSPSTITEPTADSLQSVTAKEKEETTASLNSGTIPTQMAAHFKTKINEEASHAITENLHEEQTTVTSDNSAIKLSSKPAGVKQQMPESIGQQLISSAADRPADWMLNRDLAPRLEMQSHNTLLGRSNELYFCTYCDIIFLNRAMYNLHAGLHNCNSPLQCNICGKKCATALEFSAHIIHS